MPFRHYDRIRFEQTDAAGVVYFAQVLSVCHAAYEESLARAGIRLDLFFSAQGGEIVPIIRAEIDFRQPLRCGDPYWVEVDPQPVSDQAFRICYQVRRPDQAPDQTTDLLVATAMTEHLCLNPATRRRQTLSPLVQRWIQETHQAECAM
jgi:1,4-dihydroxy-2-naphthoyl-CoA hydrolase